MRFGQRTGERESSPQHEYYIKTFRDPKTVIRFLYDDPGFMFVEVKEHFDKANKMSYPCAKGEGADACIGCDYPVEHPDWTDAKLKSKEIKVGDEVISDRDARRKHDPGWGVRDTSSKWIFPAIDPQDYVSVYKIGFKFWESLKGVHELLGTITAQDFAVLRTGSSFNDTGYSAQAIGQPYERKPKVAVPTPDTISDILGRNYVYAMAKYGHDVSGMDTGGPRPTPASEQAPNPEPQVDPANVPPTEPEKPPMGDAETRADLFVPRDSAVGEIKDFLDSLEPKVEYPKKAGRPVLVSLAEAEIAKRQGNPPF